MNEFKFRICRTQLDHHTKDLKEPKLEIKHSELISGSHMLPQVECLICKNIALFPMCCNLCDVIMCVNCVSKYKETQQKVRMRSERIKTKCPNCLQMCTPRALSKRLMDISFN